MNGIDVGQTQYIDAYQRATLWDSMGGTSYHTLFDYVPVPAVDISIPADQGSVQNIGGCGWLGSLSIAWWNNYVQGSLLPALNGRGAGPDSLVVFLFNSVVMYDPTNNQCCALGFHSAYTTSAGIQTYITADYDTTGRYDPDIAPLSHEFAEWLVNPLVTNTAPSWGYIVQVGNGCSSQLEVADPLSGTLYPRVSSNGFGYNPQELAFLSWFFRLPAGGAGVFSDNGTLTSNAGPVCR
jgi:hypothetical protein